MAEEEEGHDIYQLLPLLYPALPINPNVNPASPIAANLAVRCAEAHHQNLYVGSSDGHLHHYILQDEGSSSNPDQFALKNSLKVSASGKPVEKILILAAIDLVAILAEATLTFYRLPDLGPVQSASIVPVRGVNTVVVDDAEVANGGDDGEWFVSLCILKKKTASLVKVGKGQWRNIKEVPLPAGTLLARRYGDTLCTATAYEYSLVNLSSSRVISLGLPITHSSSPPSASNRPSIISVPSTSHPNQCDFLITGHSDEQTLGVFVEATGEPSPKLLEFESHPRALCVEGNQVMALLHNDTVQVFDIEKVQRVQKIQLPDLLQPRLLASGQSILEISTATVKPGDFIESINLTDRTNQEQCSGTRALLSATSHPSWKSVAINSEARHTRLLMTCKNAVQCFVEPIPLAEAVPMIAQRRWGALESLVSSVWEKQQIARIATEQEEKLQDQAGVTAVQRIYSLLTFYHLSRVDFFAVTEAFLRSNLDVRFLLRLFSDLWDVQTDSNNVESTIFAPLVELVQGWRPLDEMLAENLALNYGTDTSDIPEVEELRQQLRKRAWDMIETVLEASRTSRYSSTVPPSIIDTALARVYGLRGKKEQLAAFLMTNNACSVKQIDPLARELGLEEALAELYLRRRDYVKTLEMWTARIDAAHGEETGRRGVADVVQLLDDAGQPELQSRYALWVVKYDAKAGVRLLTKSSGGYGSDLSSPSTVMEESEAIRILTELRKAEANDAADQFLESVVLPARQQSSELHRQLVDLLIGKVLSSLQQPNVREILLDITNEYRQGGYAEAFVGHLTLQITTLPAILDRLKLIMILQGSQAYNVKSLLESIGSQPLLAYERAILLGKLGRKEEALRLLALDLHDANSAEAYCSQGGISVLSPFMAKQIAESVVGATEGNPSMMLKGYAKLVSRGHRMSLKSLSAVDKTSSSPAAKKDELLQVLLRLYMSSSEQPDKTKNSSRQADTSAILIPATHLLSTQALHLDPLSILPLVPDHWPLSTLSTFLKRNLRRSSGRRCEGSLQRALRLHESLKISEEVWSTSRGMGGVIQEAEDVNGGDEGGAPEAEEVRSEGFAGEEKVFRYPAEKDRPEAQQVVEEIRPDRNVDKEWAQQRQERQGNIDLT